MKGKREIRPFVATRRQDGTFSFISIVMELLAATALESSEFGPLVKAPFRPTVSGTEAEVQTIETIWSAIKAKHFHQVDSHGTKKDLRATARELIIDTLANKPDWAPYAGIFHAFAQLNDRDFFEQVVRGAQRKRKTILAPEEWFLLLNWHGWFDCPSPGSGLEVCPPLKYWTDEAILNLIQVIDDKPRTLSGLRTKRTRLALTQSKPAKVRGFFPVAGKPGQFRIDD